MENGCCRSEATGRELSLLRLGAVFPCKDAVFETKDVRVIDWTLY